MDFRDPFVPLAEVYNDPVNVNSAPANLGRMPPQEAKRVYNLWFDLVELEEHTTAADKDSSTVSCSSAS